MDNPCSYCKTYWSLLKTLLNGRKVPLIPPIQIGDKFISNFTEKAKGFSYYFAKQCSVIDNNSQLPDCVKFCTSERLNNIKFAFMDILKF